MSMKLFRLRLALAMLVALTLSLAPRSSAAQAKTGSIHGTVTSPIGVPVQGTISLYQGGITSPDEAPKYTFQSDANGKYKGSNIEAGSYTVTFRQPDTPKNQVVDQFDNVKIVAGQDTEQNFDMTRAAFLAKLPPEERKKVEETVKKNAAILKENSKIKNLNADLGTARSDDAAHNYAAAAALMQKDVNIMPDAAVLWVELGMAQRGEKDYADAINSLQKGIAMDKASKKPHAEMLGGAEDALGESLASTGKYPEAQAAYDAAATDNPTSAGTYYTNETIMMTRFNQTDATVAAADKAIAANPNGPLAYYLKGQALVSKATVDPKTQKIIAPPGCLEAYQKYLQLAPNGQFAGDAKAVIQEMSQTQSTSYNTGKKKKKH
jgi:tetratricopeptide (TPR) repeat protein